VVPHLGRVIENAALRLLDDVFQRQVFELGALDQVVQVRDVSLMVLAVVLFQRLGRDVRLQGILGVRQWRQGMFHVLFLGELTGDFLEVSAVQQFGRLF
jgi:hypothetical protein